MSSSPEALALDFLKGKENPFASLARPQRFDDYFLDLHVPDLLARERQQLLEIIDHYRIAEYTRTADLPPTAVVTILGDRGAGKTHLLQSLSYREDGKSQLLVRPKFFDKSVAVEEFLLDQLVRTLLGTDEAYGSRPIDDLALALTRRLLRQAVRALGPTDRLFALRPSGWQRLRLLMGGGQSAGRVFEHLELALEENLDGDSLHQLLARHGLQPEQCFQLLCGHLRQLEPGTEPLSRLRSDLYTAMARTALLGNSDPLNRLLEGEYTQLGAEAAARADTVNCMLHVVAESCALVRLPVVFAFDNLEAIFNPQNRFDDDLVRAFWSSLAQVIDNTRGLLVLLFAERGLFERASALMDSFAQLRLSQGVPVFGRGPVDRILLDPPRADNVHALVKGRMARLLGQFGGKGKLPDTFPFPADALAKELSITPNLRSTLMRLRDEYSRIVYEQGPAVSAPAPVKWDSVFETRWRTQLADTSRNMSGSNSVAAYRQDLHAGLGAILQQLISKECEGWQLTGVQSNVSIGDNPTYGKVSVLTWTRPADVAGNSAGGEGDTLKLGIGFLLAQGNGMAPDLQAKFDFFRRPTSGDHLVILWHTPRDGDDLVEVLPDKTRAAWDASRFRKRTTLRRLAPEQLRVLLAFPEWLNSLAAITDQPAPVEMIRSFCVEQFQAVLELVTPPDKILERTAVHEN